MAPSLVRPSPDDRVRFGSGSAGATVRVGAFWSARSSFTAGPTFTQLAHPNNQENDIFGLSAVSCRAGEIGSETGGGQGSVSLRGVGHGVTRRWAALHGGPLLRSATARAAR